MRTTIAFASFAAAFAAKCTRQELADLNTVLGGLTFTAAGMAAPPSGSTISAITSNTDLATYVLDKYKALPGRSAVTTLTGIQCWDNCLKTEYQDRRAETAAAHSCNTDGDSCKTFVAAQKAAEFFCIKRNVEEPCSAAEGASIAGAVDAAYDVAVGKLATGATAGDFKTQLALAMEAAVKGSSTLVCYNCFETYATAKFSAATHVVTTADTTVFTACKAAHIAEAPTACPAAAISALKSSANMIDVLVAGEPDVDFMPKIAKTLNTQFGVADVRALGCFMCEVDYIQTIFDSTGARVTGFEVGSKGEATAQATRDTCMTNSIETTTTTTAAAGAATTTASGVASVGVSAAAVVAIALANL